MLINFEVNRKIPIAIIPDNNMIGNRKTFTFEGIQWLVVEERQNYFHRALALPVNHLGDIRWFDNDEITLAVNG